MPIVKEQDTVVEIQSYCRNPEIVAAVQAQKHRLQLFIGVYLYSNKSGPP